MPYFGEVREFAVGVVHIPQAPYKIEDERKWPIRLATEQRIFDGDNWHPFPSAGASDVLAKINRARSERMGNYDALTQPGALR